MVVAAAGFAVAVGSWLALFMGAGNVGLQRSISVGATSLAEHPAALVGVGMTAFALSLLLTAARDLGPGRLVLAVLAWDAVAALVLAPLAVGELTPREAPLVFAAVTVLGLQPVAVLAGSAVGRLVRGRPR